MLVGVTPTCVGNSRLPRLRRLARKTCGPGIALPLYQKNAMIAPATTIAPTPHRAAAPGPEPDSIISGKPSAAWRRRLTLAPGPVRGQGFSAARATRALMLILSDRRTVC